MCFAGETVNERSCYEDCAAQRPRNLTEVSSPEDHSILPGVVESRANNLYSTVQVEGKDNTITSQV